MKLEAFAINNDPTDLYTFPTTNVTDRLGDVEAAADFLATPLGGYDTGDEEAADRPALITKGFTLYAHTPEDQQPLLDALRRLRGKRGTLWARTYDGHVRHLLHVRCKRIQIDRTNRNFQFQPVVVQFEAPNQHWRGRRHEGGWLLDDGHYFDDGLYLNEDSNTWSFLTSPSVATITNGGNRAVTDVRLIFLPNASFTSISFGSGDAHLEWTGTLQDQDEFVIDTGAQRVTINGAAAYAGFSLGAGHKIEDWIRLEPGENQIAAEALPADPDASWRIEFADGWY